VLISVFPARAETIRDEKKQRQVYRIFFLRRHFLVQEERAIKEIVCGPARPDPNHRNFHVLLPDAFHVGGLKEAFKVVHIIQSPNAFLPRTVKETWTSNRCNNWRVFLSSRVPSGIGPNWFGRGGWSGLTPDGELADFYHPRAPW
jgi:hypothetical protein